LRHENIHFHLVTNPLHPANLHLTSKRREQRPIRYLSHEYGWGRGKTGRRFGSLPKSAKYTDYGLLSIPQIGDSDVFFFGLQLPPALTDLRPYIEDFATLCLLRDPGHPSCSEGEN
jgi:hypothetical protein